MCSLIAALSELCLERVEVEFVPELCNGTLGVKAVKTQRIIEIAAQVVSARLERNLAAPEALLQGRIQVVHRRASIASERCHGSAPRGWDAIELAVENVKRANQRVGGSVEVANHRFKRLGRLRKEVHHRIAVEARVVECCAKVGDSNVGDLKCKHEVVVRRHQLAEGHVCPLGGCGERTDAVLVVRHGLFVVGDLVVELTDLLVEVASKTLKLLHATEVCVWY